MIFAIEHLGTIFEMAFSISSVVDGPLLGVFILGMMCPWVGKKGAIFGAWFSLIVMTWIVGGAQWYTFKGKIQHAVLPASIENCTKLLGFTITRNEVSTTPIPNIWYDEEEDSPFIFHYISVLYLTLVGGFITVVFATFTSVFCDEVDTSKVDPKHLASIVRRYLSLFTYLFLY